jgi:predicted nucleic acid-binding protein
MKFYLDTCCLNRPLDDKSQVLVAIEAEAVLALLTLCESGIATLLSSDVIRFEVDRTPNPQRRTFVSETLALAATTISLTAEIDGRARDLAAQGFSALDALHLASAEAGGADYFCTCDVRLVKNARSHGDLSVAVRTPLELVQEVIK